MDVHPICALLPEMSAAEYAGLVESIRSSGLQTPIRTYEGKILDGRHRFRACMDAGESPRFESYDGDDPIGFVRASCVHRNLSTSQRALIAAGFLEYERQQAKVRQVELAGTRKVDLVETLPQGSGDTGKSRDKAGARMGVSGKSVAAAESVLTNAMPAVVQLVRSGEMTVNEAMRVSKLNRSAQEKIAQAPKITRADVIRTAATRSETAKRRLTKPEAVALPGTPFVRRFLGGLERVAMVCAEDGTKDASDIASRFAIEMEWDSEPLRMQLDRCQPVIDAVSIITAKLSAARAA